MNAQNKQMLTTYLSTSARTPQDSLIQGDLPSTTTTTATDPLTNWDTVRFGGFLRHFVIRLLKRNNEVLRNPSPDYKPTDITNLWLSVILCNTHPLSRDGLVPTECQGLCRPRDRAGLSGGGVRRMRCPTKASPWGLLGNRDKGQLQPECRKL